MKKVIDKIHEFLGIVFFGWWGEDRKILQAIKAIPFMIVMGPLLLAAEAEDAIKKFFHGKSS